MADLQAMSAAEIEEYRNQLQERMEALRHEFMYAGVELARKRKVGEMEEQRAHLDAEIAREQTELKAEFSAEEAYQKAFDQVVGLKTLSIKGKIRNFFGKGE